MLLCSGMPTCHSNAALCSLFVVNASCWLDVVSHNRIGEEGAKFLAKGLVVNETLKILRVRGTYAIPYDSSAFAVMSNFLDCCPLSAYGIYKAL